MYSCEYPSAGATTARTEAAPAEGDVAGGGVTGTDGEDVAAVAAALEGIGGPRGCGPVLELAGADSRLGGVCGACDSTGIVVAGRCVDVAGSGTYGGPESWVELAACVKVAGVVGCSGS